MFDMIPIKFNYDPNALPTRWGIQKLKLLLKIEIIVHVTKQNKSKRNDRFLWLIDFKIRRARKVGRPDSSDSRSGLVCIVLGILNHFRRFWQVRKVDQYLSKRRLVLIKKLTVFIRKSANVYQKVEQCFGGYERYTKLKVLANFQSYLSFQPLFH